MRNRGIEIFLLPQQGGVPAQQEMQAQEAAEMQQVLALAGLPGSTVPAAMAAAHAAVAAHAAQRHRCGHGWWAGTMSCFDVYGCAVAGRGKQSHLHCCIGELLSTFTPPILGCRRPPGLRELRRWAALTTALASRGWPFPKALHTAWRQLYVRTEAAAAAGAEEAVAVAQAAFEAHVLPLLHAQRQAGGSCDLVLARPAAWPQPLGAAAFAADSVVACVQRDAALLLQYLAVLAAEQLQQPGSLAAASAAVVGSRGALVGEVGLATAAGMPAAALVQLLAGCDAASLGDAAAAAAAAAAASGALLCVPAAARVFAERCGPQHRSLRAAYAAALAAQLQQLLAAGGGSASSQAALAAQQAEQLVSGVLGHPLAAAAAALQQQLAAAVRLPEGDAGFLPLDATAAQQLQLFLLAAGLQECGSSGGSLQQLWQQAQEVSSKVAALWHAMHSAVVLRSAAAAADGAVAEGAATLLQLSLWRHQRPKVGRPAWAAGVCSCMHAVVCMQLPLP